jgi:hypothetical protein
MVGEISPITLTDGSERYRLFAIVRPAGVMMLASLLACNRAIGAEADTF